MAEYTLTVTLRGECHTLQGDLPELLYDVAEWLAAQPQYGQVQVIHNQTRAQVYP